ncbi:Phenylalanine/tyrosine ammonia-lyase [Diplogelasinospora grovesii]|uniref:Phenylalanine/tyrosine ammonia-lyase n=1 Tax=Diplogelasinospora grovesii TaxID=303347 RepID=A0AAN6RZ63_9PEZI|nr:Phenylalanine/tyrosine ammonia-lyase [Diplogelasinospora grovesii]
MAEDSSHAKAVYAEWLALQEILASPNKHITLTGHELTIPDVIAASLHGTKATLTADEEIVKRVTDSVTFLQEELASGRIIYGVNTGFGGSADTRTENFERLQSAAIQHLNVGILLQADKGQRSERKGKRKNELLRGHALPVPIVRATMLIRCNSLMRGHSGVRIEVIDTIITLLARGLTPVIPLRGSISASGDLSTLSYIAGAVEGNPDVFVKIGDMCLSAHETLKIAGLEPVRLQAKEGLGITNGTAPSCAMGCIVIHEANRLAVLVQLLTAMGTEALAGTAHNYDPFISQTRPHAGQSEAASTIRRFLSGSKISPDRDPDRIGLAQDRYALRTAPQWIGPQLEDLKLATQQVKVELNSTTDNPLIDVEGKRIHHGGNFQAMAITSAMEKTMTALQNLGRLLFAQSSELINNMTNKGLPPNLSADEPSQSFTFKGFDVNMAAYMSELAYLAKPVSTHVQIAEMANQSVNSMALVAARYALEAVEVLSLMAATYIYTLCQALDLRCILLEFRKVAANDLGLAIESILARAEDEDVKEVVLEKKGYLLTKTTQTLLQRWDELSHLDAAQRAGAVAQESLGTFVQHLASKEFDASNLNLRLLQDYQTLVSEALLNAYRETRTEFFKKQTTAGWISPASKVVYDFVRKELGIPLNRGVEDHPPLLLAKREQEQQSGASVNGPGNNIPNRDAQNFSRANGNVYQDMEDANPMRGKILGTMAGEIYEAVRNGELHDRIMRFGEQAGMWM